MVSNTLRTKKFFCVLSFLTVLLTSEGMLVSMQAEH